MNLVNMYISLPLRKIYRMTSLSIRIYGWRFFISVFLKLVGLAFPLITAWVTKYIYDYLTIQTAADTHYNIILFLLLLLFLLTIINPIIQGWMQYINLIFNNKMILETDRLIYGKLVSLDSLAYFENTKFYDVLYTATEGANSSLTNILDNISNLVSNVLFLLGTVGLLFSLDIFFGLVCFISVIPSFFIKYKSNREHFETEISLALKYRKKAYYASILSSPSYAKEVKFFETGNYFFKIITDIIVDIQKLRLKQQVKEIIINFILAVINSTIYTLIFSILIFKVISGENSIGDILFYSATFGSVHGTLRDLISGFIDLKQNTLYFDKFEKLLNLPSLLHHPPEYRFIKPLTNEIVFKNVAFRYDEKQDWIIKDFDLRIEKGKHVAVVGLNGAGKSTIVKLLTRMYDPIIGNIFWDNTDIREFKVSEYRSRLTAIFQDFGHYDLSFRENIAIGDIGQIDDISFIHGLTKLVELDKFVESLPSKYETVISRYLTEEDKSHDLSGGQWQKVAIGRMLMRHADVYLLDEPTSSLDAKAEAELYVSILDHIKGKTAIIISHRLNTIRMVDQIVVIEHGAVVEVGTYEQLWKVGTKFYNIFKNENSRH